MNYFKKHWRGDLSLAVSFWVNFLLVDVFLVALTILLEIGSYFMHPNMNIWLTILMVYVTVLFIYPWQFVGVWRSANRHREKKEHQWVATPARTLLVIVFLFNFVTVVFWSPAYLEMVFIVAIPDLYGGFEVDVSDDGRFVHVSGGMDVGVSARLKKVLEGFPDIEGVILDSHGGATWEGRELAGVIRDRGLDTYTLTGCYSACTVAFIAGERRFAAEESILGFHAYSTLGPYLDKLTGLGLEDEQSLDSELFLDQGVSEEFVDRIFETGSEDMWEPGLKELLAAGVVHEVVRASDIVPEAPGPDTGRAPGPAAE